VVRQAGFPAGPSRSCSATSRARRGWSRRCERSTRGCRPAVAPDAGPARLSARERELVTLVAQGRTDAQIAAQLDISVQTVGSDPDRIRNQTGCRRRSDLTRLALQEALV
jgi:DNA-binding CsgD family transcriptional regulator